MTAGSTSVVPIDAAAPASHALDLHAPQLGELAWHTVTNDTTVDAQSDAHLQAVRSAIASHLPGRAVEGLRVLEVAAYRHHSLHALASDDGAECVVTDIAPTSLIEGLAAARLAGRHPGATAVVADFLDLPFSTGYFDVVFIATAVHHTWQPERVLRELFRVTAPGGIVIVHDEPVRRICCFYAFRSNRSDAFTPFETYLDGHGLLPTISSPFWGSRPEELFGMTENDRIPLDLFRTEFTRHGTIEELHLTNTQQVGDFEHRILALEERGDALQGAVFDLLADAVDDARPHLGALEHLLGYELPTVGEVHAVARAVASTLSSIRRPDGASLDDDAPPSDRVLADLFGASVSAVVRRAPVALTDTTDAAPSAPSAPSERRRRLRWVRSSRTSRRPVAATPPDRFRRPMTERAGGLWTEADGSHSGAGRLTATLLPDVFRPEHRDRLATWFPPEDWLVNDEANGAISLVNLNARSRVQLGLRDSDTVLLFRYYAVVGDGQPFRVRVSAGDRVLGDQLVALQETRLLRAELPSAEPEIVVEILDLDGHLVTPGWQLRVSVFQLVRAHQARSDA